MTAKVGLSLVVIDFYNYCANPQKNWATTRVILISILNTFERSEVNLVSITIPYRHFNYSTSDDCRESVSN